MKKMLLLAVVLVFLPKAHACTVTVTPASHTLQETQTEGLTATLTSCTGSSTVWSLSCVPSGACGFFTNTTNTSATYHTPATTPSQQLAVTIKAKYGTTTGTASATIIIPTSLALSPTNSSIYLGGANQTMTATEVFSDQSTQNVTSSASFSSSNTNVATVNGNSVTSVNFGGSTISATYTDPLAGTQLNGSTPLTVTTAAQINAVFPPAIPKGSLNTQNTCTQFYPSVSANWATFMNNLLGNQNQASNGKYIWGVNQHVVWNQIETSQGNYDFTCLDLNLQSFVNAGKKINLIVQGVSDGEAGNLNNPSTPLYVLSDGVDVFYDPQGTQKNLCTYQKYPAVYESGYVTPWQNFVKAALQHYSSSCSTGSLTVPPCSGNSNANGPTLAPSIGYIRFGLSTGGEAFPHCTPWLKTLPAPNTYVSELSPFNTQNPQPQTWLTYVSTMDAYEKNLNSSIQLMGALNEAETNYAYPDGEAYYAVQNGQGFGSQGLQESDKNITDCTTNNTHSTSDWCYLFNLYHTQVSSRELQTLKVSDPTNTLATGSLNDIVPFAVSKYANVFEIYTTDLFLAFDPSDYNSSLPGYNLSYASYSSSYNTTLINAVSGN